MIIYQKQYKKDEIMNVAVLISGGVDSSVALALLKKQGYQVTAFYLKIWLEDELSYLGTCPWQEDLSYARKVCEQLKVSLEVVSLQREYWDNVVSYAINQIKVGHTPNPDVFCNKLVKFGVFFEYLAAYKSDQFDFVASGHYAKVEHTENGSILMRAPDPIKDQTYFLSYLTQNQLRRILFPIGDMNKAHVRRLAQELNLPTKKRRDSQGICFLGKLKFKDFIKHHLGERVGDLIEFETDIKLGKHQGFWYFTIGQRQGTGLAGGPWYVVKKDVKKNIVFVSRDYYAQDKSRDTFEVGNCNWFAKITPNKKKLQVKIRHGKTIYDCMFTPQDNVTARVILSERDQGIAPGQFAVFYDGEHCLGAGVITRTINNVYR